MAGLRIVTNCIGQHIVLGRVPKGIRSDLARMGWGWARSNPSGTRGIFWTDDTEQARRTAETLGIPFATTPQLRENA